MPNFDFGGQETFILDIEKAKDKNFMICKRYFFKKPIKKNNYGIESFIEMVARASWYSVGE
jgi:hypothetical protein